MGAEQSSNEKKISDRNISEAELKKIIEQQKQIFETNYVKLLNTTQGIDEAYLAEQTREEARKEVEKILKEREAANINTASTSGVAERQRTPYNLPQSALPSQANTNIYPTIYPATSHQSNSFSHPTVNNPQSYNCNNQPPNYYAATNQAPPVNVQYNSTFAPYYPTHHQNANPNSGGNLNSGYAYNSSPSAPIARNDNYTGNKNFSPANNASNPTAYNNNTSLPNTSSNTKAVNPNLTGKKNASSSNTLTNPMGNNNTRSSNTSANSTVGPSNSTGNIKTRTFKASSNATVSNPSQAGANANVNSTVNAKKTDENIGLAEHPLRSAPRDRSASRNRIRNRKDNKNDELNCRTCYRKFTVKIYQCLHGHSSCSNCRARSANCGICSNQITDVRNRTLEEYISERKIPCPNSNDGCRLYIKISEMDLHEKECAFQEMKCPLADVFGQCTWRGKLPQIATHFDDVHSMHRQGTVDTEMCLLNLKNDHQVVYLVTIGTFNFLFHLKVNTSNRMLYMTVQLLGTNHSAAKWTYDIHVYNKNQPRKKFQYIDVCRSDKVPLKEVLEQGNCAMLPLSYAENFVHDGKFTYKFYIKREEDQVDATRRN